MSALQQFITILGTMSNHVPGWEAFAKRFHGSAYIREELARLPAFAPMEHNSTHEIVSFKLALPRTTRWAEPIR